MLKQDFESCKYKLTKKQCNDIIRIKQEGILMKKININWMTVHGYTPTHKDEIIIATKDGDVVVVQYYKAPKLRGCTNE